MPGGLKLAWLTQLATMAPLSSALRVVSTQREPITRPRASTAGSLRLSLKPPALRRCARFWLCSSWRAKRVPVSSSSFTRAASGLNFTRIGSKPKLKPPSRSFVSSRSTASPLQPKLPNTPTGLLRSPSANRVPRAETIGVGAWPPRVGEPINTASACWIVLTSSSAGVNSQFKLFTRMPVRLTPRARASAMAAVLP